MSLSLTTKTACCQRAKRRRASSATSALWMGGLVLIGTISSIAILLFVTVAIPPAAWEIATVADPRLIAISTEKQSQSTSSSQDPTHVVMVYSARHGWTQLLDIVDKATIPAGDLVVKSSTPASVLLERELRSIWGLRVHMPVHQFASSPLPPSKDKQSTHDHHWIVTAYFHLDRSKYAPEQYTVHWIPNLLSLQDAMVVFTESSMVDLMWQHRSHALDRTVLVELPNITSLPVASLRYPPHRFASANAFWQHQLQMDPEQRRHQSYQLFWIWLSKSWFVYTALNDIILEPAFGLTTATTGDSNQSPVLFYSDIGCFRSRMYNGQQLLQHVTDVLPDHDTILWMAHHPPHPPPHPLWTHKLQEPQFYYHSGSQAAGYGVAWQAFHQQFARTIEEFLEYDLFIGEDQCVLQSTCQHHPSLCAYITADQIRDNHYFGLRTAIFKGGSYNLWRPRPDTTAST